MDLKRKEKFLELWKKYFGMAELPFVFYYHNEVHNALRVKREKGRSCIICELAQVRNGKSLAYDAEAIACRGAKRYFVVCCSNDKIRQND